MCSFTLAGSDFAVLKLYSSKVIGFLLTQSNLAPAEDNITSNTLLQH